jgi:hypothetical protein
MFVGREVHEIGKQLSAYKTTPAPYPQSFPAIHLRICVDDTVFFGL